MLYLSFEIIIDSFLYIIHFSSIINAVVDLTFCFQRNVWRFNDIFWEHWAPPHLLWVPPWPRWFCPRESWPSYSEWPGCCHWDSQTIPSVWEVEAGEVWLGSEWTDSPAWHRPVDTSLTLCRVCGSYTAGSSQHNFHYS